MKFLYTFIAFLFCFLMTAQQPFVTTWEVTAGDLDITIPTNPAEYTYDYTVDFGDGTILNNQTGDVTHNYVSPGIYQVSISGVFPHFYSIGFYGFTNPNYKLKSIEQWGNNQWLSMEGAFSYCSSMNINALDSPNLSQVESMSRMFQWAGNLNTNLNNWDISNVTDLSFMFINALSFNEPLDDWDLSNAINMWGMFKDANSFNQNINNWDVSNVTDMRQMFKNADNFNQPLNNWNVSNVTKMKDMFNGAVNFNQPLDNWDTYSVVNMWGMFKDATSFNQTIDNWNVSNVENMNYMFQNASSFNHSLNNWNIGNIHVIDMSYMFYNATSFNQPLNNWDVSLVTNMSNMFHGAAAFNQPLDNWDVSLVTKMTNMFKDATSFNQPLNSWNVSNVLNTSGMFWNATSFNQTLNNWDVSILNINSMFRNATSFNQPLSSWDVSSVSTNIGFVNMFKGASAFNQDLSNWNFPNGELPGFIDNSGINKANYELLLQNLVSLSHNDGNLGAESMKYCDAFTRGQLISAGWTISGDGLANDCDLNYVLGNVLYDQENDGCDASDNGLSGYLINANDGSEDAAFTVDENGQYLIPLDTGNYTLSILNLNSNFTSTPPTQTINFTGQNEILENNNFCIIADQQFDDLSIDVFPLEDAIPGFETVYQIIFSNNGTQNVSNYQVTFAYDNNFQSFISATETPSGNITNLLTFNLTNLEPFSQEFIEITMLNAVPPTLNGGENLTLTTQITPDVNDINSDDNTAVHNQTVVNSFDPNDKLVIQGDEIADEDKDQYLDYRIRFQNVGTANALNVKITDTISGKLDWTTFQPITSSHNYRIELIDQEEINFIFDNINLPFESADPEGSNGYITYKIKPKSDVQIGDIIENKAYIFFDFNAPIITNTVSTEIVDNLSTTDFVQPENIKLSPNPADDQVEIINESNAAIKSLQLYSIKGQLINTFTDKNLIDISQLSSGVYILQVETQHNKINKRLIKR